MLPCRQLDMDRLVISHATSTYPCDPAELNLHMIETLRQQFPAQLVIPVMKSV